MTKYDKHLKDKLESYLTEVNQHRIDKALEFLSEEFVLHFAVSDFQIDKKGMINVMGWDQGVNGRVSWQNLTIDGDSVSGLFTERNDFLQLLGIEKLDANITYIFNEASQIDIQMYNILPGQPSFRERLKPAIEWAMQNRPRDLENVYPAGQMVFNREMGKKWLTLLKDWKDQNSDASSH